MADNSEDGRSANGKASGSQLANAGVVRTLEAAYWRMLRMNVRADNVISGARETVVDRLRRTYLSVDSTTSNGSTVRSPSVPPIEQSLGNGSQPKKTPQSQMAVAHAPGLANSKEPSKLGASVVSSKRKPRIPLPFYGLAHQKFLSREVVFTCVVGDRHFLQEPSEDCHHEHVVFADRDLSFRRWIQRPLLFWDANPKVITLFHKFVLSSLAPLDTKFIWVDSRVDVSADVVRALFAKLDDHELCLFRHYERDCVYDEILAVLQARRSSTAQCEDYAKYLRERAFPRRTGLYETGVIAFRVTPATRQLFQKVFGLCYRYVPRDQLTLPCALAESDVRVALYNDGVTHLRDSPGILVRPWMEDQA